MKRIIVFLLVMSSAVFGATKVELISELGTKFDVVGQPQLVQSKITGYDVSWYQIPVLQLNEDSSALGRTIYFHVKNEGEVDEAAFFAKAVPQAPEDVFRVAIATYLKTNSIILKNIIQLDKVEKWAECLVWEYDSTDDIFIEKRILVRKPVDTFTHKTIQ